MGVLETDAEVCEVRIAISVVVATVCGRGAWLRVVVVICEDGDGGGADRGEQHGRDVG